MKICYFGMYAARYSRNRVIIKGLRQNSVEVIECNDRSHLFFGGRYFKLLKKFFSLSGHHADIIFVGFPGQTDVPLAWFLGKLFHKKVVFDAFFSLYVSQVFDRKHVTEKSLMAKVYFFVDWLSCVLSDKIILDTNTHIDYFVQTFRIPKKKFARVFVGTDSDIFIPQKLAGHTGFVAGWHGSFLPLQGVPVILKAAKLLKNKKITFRLLGNGLKLAECLQMARDYKLDNVEFFKEVPYEKLPDFIANTDVYLGGHFADSLKSKLVIPNKVYESMAMQKPVIVGDCEAARELFTDKVDCLLIKQGNPKELAKAILNLKKDQVLRDKISLGGYNLVAKRLSPIQVTKSLVSLLKDST